jgi:histidinol-phosphate aminotransferase
VVNVAVPALIENEPYTPGLSSEYVSAKFCIELDDVAKLGSVENPFGPSPKAFDAVQKCQARLSLYPVGTSKAPRVVIAKRYGLEGLRRLRLGCRG